MSRKQAHRRSASERSCLHAACLQLGAIVSCGLLLHGCVGGDEQAMGQNIGTPGSGGPLSEKAGECTLGEIFEKIVNFKPMLDAFEGVNMFEAMGARFCDMKDWRMPQTAPPGKAFVREGTDPILNEDYRKIDKKLYGMCDEEKTLPPDTKAKELEWTDGADGGFMFSFLYCLAGNQVASLEHHHLWKNDLKDDCSAGMGKTISTKGPLPSIHEHYTPCEDQVYENYIAGQDVEEYASELEAGQEQETAEANEEEKEEESLMEIAEVRPHSFLNLSSGPASSRMLNLSKGRVSPAKLFHGLQEGTNKAIDDTPIANTKPNKSAAFEK